MMACMLMVVLLTTSVMAEKIRPMPISSPEDFKAMMQLSGDRSFTYSGAIIERLVPGKYGWTELMEAAANADTEAVKSLLAKGVDVNAKDDVGSSALIVAASGGHIEIVRLLLDAGADVNTRDKYGRTALSEARHDNDVAVIHTLLDNGADPNTKFIGEISLLEFASQEGRKEIVQALLDNGADLRCMVAEPLYQRQGGAIAL